MSYNDSRKYAFPEDYPEEELRSFVPYVYDTVFSNSQISWFMQQFTSFNKKYQPEFAEIKTSRGTGFTFNMIDDYELLNFEHINSDFNYTRDVTTEPKNLKKFPDSIKYPLKFKKSDRVVFTAKITKPIGNYANCIKQSIMVHQPDYLPTFSIRKDFITFEYGSILDVIVTTEITRTDENLRKLSATERGCYFKGEKELYFFNTYSQKNCEVECITYITLKECGCVHVDQPYIDTEDVCLNISSSNDNSHKNCIIALHSAIYLSGDQQHEDACACLPLCNSINYNINYQTTHEKHEIQKNFEWQRNGNEAIINVRMNMDDIVLYRRYQQFTFSDVVSYVGGLFGLFAGISMLSIVEFIYFFTIRLGVNLWRILRSRD
ncbi:unnamed protein product [Chironomus riparius]|uniref:Uncharacterized protein n=1 Tax=Chironomus riparius TaxID=315576 RepID=A0A9N9WSE6_9DIPT|nr:unnamed protein product [Chironomus riparius]